jgi:cobalt/nickel transport system permease protein
MIPSFLLEKENIESKGADKNKKLSFIDKTINNAVLFISSTFLQWETAKKNGLFQMLDSRVKVTFLLLFVLLVSFTGETKIQFMIAFFLFLLCVSSRLNIVHIYKKILATGVVFGFLIFVPASLNIFTNGENAFTIFHFQHAHSWWIYNIPQDISVTDEGIKTVVRLTLKVINSVTIVLLVVYTTTFERIVKSLSIFKIPDIFLLTLTLTYKFIFILSNTIIETYRAIKMRWWNRSPVKDVEKIIAGRIGFLFRKSWERYDLVYQSMIARGFNGKVNFYYFDKLKITDYLFTIVFLLIFSCLILINYFHVWNI